MNQRLLVFGGGGFVVGNLLALALRDGWEVHVADAAVREAHPAAAIVRISLVLGFPITDGSSFIAGLEKKLAARGSRASCTSAPPTAWTVSP